MNIANLLTPRHIRCGVTITSKKRSLELLAELLADPEDEPSARAVFESLVGRERLGSTGLGKGVALPHARVAGIAQPAAALVTLEKPIDFDALDHRPVDLLLALAVPEHSTDEHLRILATLAEMFSDRDLCDGLRASGSAEEAFELLSGWRGAGS